jgi:hypothetical protein
VVLVPVGRGRGERLGEERDQLVNSIRAQLDLLVIAHRASFQIETPKWAPERDQSRWVTAWTWLAISDERPSLTARTRLQLTTTQRSIGPALLVPAEPGFERPTDGRPLGVDDRVRR